MRTTFSVLLLSVALRLSAQLDFGSGSDGDTLLPSFGTELENQVYAYLRESPVLPETWSLLTLSPVSIKMWSVHAGWDIITLDPLEGRARGFLYDFSWNAVELSDSAVMVRLREILTYKQKSP